MRLKPFVQVDDIPFETTPPQLLRRFGPPRHREVNAAELEAFDYGDTVYRFQASGRLEEITRRAPVLHLPGVAIPFRSLGTFARAQDAHAFERAGFLVSPAFGLAFVPDEPDWVTALARHCLPTWRAM